MVTQPRRKVELIQHLFLGLVGIVLTVGVANLSELKSEVKRSNDNYHTLQLEVQDLRTTIRLGMADRFTGAEGDAMNARLVICEKLVEQHEGRLDAIDQWCASVRAKMGNGHK